MKVILRVVFALLLTSVLLCLAILRNFLPTHSIEGSLRIVQRLSH